jgi:Endonuclease-reverse transcriptase
MCQRNLRSDTLIELIENKNLQLINKPDIPTYYFRNGNGTSILDLTLSTPQINSFIREWKVDNNIESGSDHEVILFSIYLNNNDLVDNPLSINRYN